jgi:5-(carboxyamino)imidazole ribonucleotide mutase
MNASKVLVVMGSRSDLPVMENCLQMLDTFDIPYTVRILSAHRTPKEVLSLSEHAKEQGIQVIIAAAGMAAHLAGVIASSTTLPVIGVPMPGGVLDGIDALLSTVQMPGGVPVATVAVGKAGAKNAAVLAAQIIALSDPAVDAKLAAFKKEQSEQVLAQSKLED